MHMAALLHEEAGRRMPGAEFDSLCWTLSGPYSASPHGAGAFYLAGATIEQGHTIVNCVCPGIDGLIVENERTWFSGAPTKRQVKLFEAAKAANEAACEAVVADNPIWALDAAAQDVFERAGLADLVYHRTGHGLGIGGHDFPVDTAFNSTPMPERIVFSVEPGIYEIGVGGFRHDDTVVARPNSPEILTSTAKDIASQTIG
jgi:hypothetical protein